MFRRFIPALVILAATVATLASSSPSWAASLPPMHRGFNTFPWLYRARTIGGDPQRFDFANPYPYLGRYTADDFVALRKLGADVVRVPVDPSPLVAGDPTQRAAVITVVLSAMKRVTDAGLTAIVDLHPHEGVKGWGVADILASPTKLASYKEVVVDVAAAIASSRNPRLVLELMNEPQGGYSGSEGTYWIYLQPDLIKAVRAVAPTIPIIATGDRGGGIDGLLRVDPSGFDDPMIVYSFHYYDPMVITHQGAVWGVDKTRKYMRDLSYPPAPGQEATEVGELQDRIKADASQSDADRMKWVRQATATVEDYFRRPQGTERIGSDFSRVTDWAKRYHIPANRIILGEFGVYRPAASVDTVVNYARDVRSVAEGLGYGWVYFNYAPFDENGAGFSVLQMSGPTPNALNADIIHKGLGSRRPDRATDDDPVGPRPNLSPAAATRSCRAQPYRVA